MYSSCRLKKLQSEFASDFISTDGRVLFCKACEKNVGSDKRFQVVQHINTAKHKECVNKKRANKEAIQKQLVECLESKVSQFSSDLCEAFLAADIPLWKISNPVLKNFLGKYTQQHVPDESTLRKAYVSRCYGTVISKIQEKLENQFVWLSIDESTDSAGRFIANIIVGALSKEQQTTPYLLNVCQLQTTDNVTVTQCVIDSLKLLWPIGIKYDRLLLFVTDAGSYMVKSGQTLKGIFPNLIHITCLAHALHRVAETIRNCFPLVDRLVASVKKIFVKSPSRIQLFKSIAPNTPLPPAPVLTRWGTWLDAALYYAQHLQTVKEVVNSLDPSDAASIDTAQGILSDRELEGNLIFLSAHFSGLPKAITSLETGVSPLSVSLTVFEEIRCNLVSVPSTVGQKVKEKVTNVISKNPGYQKLCDIRDILEGKSSNIPQDLSLCVQQLASFRYAPITSCDVERSFSRYKSILRDNRRSFTIENFRQVLVVNCNSSLILDVGSTSASTSKE